MPFIIAAAAGLNRNSSGNSYSRPRPRNPASKAAALAKYVAAGSTVREGVKGTTRVVGAEQSPGSSVVGDGSTADGVKQEKRRGGGGLQLGREGKQRVKEKETEKEGGIKRFWHRGREM
jgi:hypothetical protein